MHLVAELRFMKKTKRIPNSVETFNVFELMEVKGGGTDDSFVSCQGSSAVTCTAQGSGVVIMPPSQPDPGKPIDKPADPKP